MKRFCNRISPPPCLEKANFRDGTTWLDSIASLCSRFAARGAKPRGSGDLLAALCAESGRIHGACRIEALTAMATPKRLNQHLFRAGRTLAVSAGGRSVFVYCGAALRTSPTTPKGLLETCRLADSRHFETTLRAAHFAQVDAPLRPHHRCGHQHDNDNQQNKQSI